MRSFSLLLFLVKSYCRRYWWASKL